MWVQQSCRAWPKSINNAQKENRFPKVLVLESLVCTVCFRNLLTCINVCISFIVKIILKKKKTIRFANIGDSNIVVHRNLVSCFDVLCAVIYLLFIVKLVKTNFFSKGDLTVN